MSTVNSLDLEGYILRLSAHAVPRRRKKETGLLATSAIERRKENPL